MRACVHGPAGILAVAFLALMLGADPGRTMGARQAVTSRKDISYGPHRRNTLDFWQAASNRPTPVLIYIHGGGFTGGDKSSIQDGFVKAFTDAGVSVASINYRFVTTHPFPAPQEDGARAVQFLRHKAGEWNIDPERIALFGGSAGGGIALWAALRADMAEPDSGDPVARQSSRVSCAAVFDAQTSYDPAVMRQWIGGNIHLHETLPRCYGARSFTELESGEFQAAFDYVSPIKHVSRDDPPVLLYYTQSEAPVGPGSSPAEGVHHPIFGLKLKREMQKAGLSPLYINANESPGDAQATIFRFILENLGVSL